MNMNNLEGKSIKKKENLKDRVARQQQKNNALADVAPTTSRKSTKIDRAPRAKTPRKKIELPPLTTVYELPREERFTEALPETAPRIDPEYGQLIDPQEESNFLEEKYFLLYIIQNKFFFYKYQKK